MSSNTPITLQSTVTADDQLSIKSYEEKESAIIQIMCDKLIEGDSTNAIVLQLVSDLMQFVETLLANKGTKLGQIKKELVLKMAQEILSMVQSSFKDKISAAITVDSYPNVSENSPVVINNTEETLKKASSLAKTSVEDISNLVELIIDIKNGKIDAQKIVNVAADTATCCCGWVNIFRSCSK